MLRNGASRYTPLWRVGSCMVGCGFWLMLAVAVESAVLAMDRSVGPPLLLAIAATAAVFEVNAALHGGADLNQFNSLRFRQHRSKVDDVPGHV